MTNRFIVTLARVRAVLADQAGALMATERLVLWTKTRDHAEHIGRAYAAHSTALGQNLIFLAARLEAECAPVDSNAPDTAVVVGD